MKVQYQLESLQSLERSLHAGVQWIHDHRRLASAAVVTLLLGTGVTAFGVAPMTVTETDTVPRRMISESVLPEVAFNKQTNAIDSYDFKLSRNDSTRRDDTADSLLSRLNVVDIDAANFLRTNPLGKKMLQGYVGKMVNAHISPAGRLLDMTARFPAEAEADMPTKFTRLSIKRDDKGQLIASTEQVSFTTRTLLGSGTIKSTLFAAADDAKLPESVATQVAEIFANEIDFRSGLKAGDHFTVLYEGLEADGELVNWGQGAGRVLAAQFVNDGKTHDALWYKESDTVQGYFDEKGENLRRSFLSSPVEFSRINSGFSMRYHPILKTWTRHLGVDYGAPIGTPVRSVGDGEVEFAGIKNGYGNVVVIRHNNDQETVYAHLSRIDVTEGQTIAQGRIVGAVGMTGWATGPHLHFEFKQGGMQVDPLEVAKNSRAVSLSVSSKTLFMDMAQNFRSQLDVARTHLMASADN